ncbi:MAG: adenylate/guanylate cyclase domain-containing protein [Treponema sp.]|jgi:adenylate cyclase|nr:adenylate/guanylate cyclase domain-containing protein [Treponema sp.]
MKDKRKGVSKKTAAALIAALVFAAAAFLHFSGALNYPEYKTYDFRVNFLANYSRPSDDIIVVLLDQASIDWAAAERGWPWPWPRRAYGEIVDYMNLAGANAVAFDVIFSEPSIYGPEDDAVLAAASGKYGRVIQTVHFGSQPGRGDSWPAELQKPLFAIDDEGARLAGLNPAGGIQGDLSALFPIGGIRDSAGAIGSVTGKPDPDSVFRRMNLFARFDGRAVPELAAASLLATGYTNELQYDKKKRIIRWGDYEIPTDKNGEIILHFRGSLDRYIPYSAGEILRSAEAYGREETPALPPEDFAGKYILFGFYAPGLFDIASTPISSTYPGVGMHITLLDNLLQRDFIRESSPLLDLLVILLPVILITFLTLFSNRIPLTVGSAVFIVAAIVLVSAGAYYYAGVWLPMAAPLAGALATFLAATLYSYATEGSQKRFIKSAFSQYLSPAVIDQLLANPSLLTLGGERREISIFFSDVQGFTTISEKLDPARLTEILNDYLSFMTDTILDSGGTIDKYEGDAIIAFWNAPVSFADHAARALGASMLCQKRLAERQDFFAEKYGCRLLTRIGINTGYAVVGNMGSGKRFDYTMLGDSVNLAARLEGLNKQFGTYLMCTEATFNQARKTAADGADAGPRRAFYGRKLAQVAVVGKKEAVTVYEPMPEEVFRRQEAALRRFDAARDFFYQGRFAEALPLFKALADQDRPSFFYAEQCRYYTERPAEWQGHWQATSK